VKHTASTAGVVATPAIDVPVEALTSFARRSGSDLGEGFQPPPTREAWHAVLGDPSQRWYAVVGDENEEQATTVIGLVVFSRWTPAPWRSAEIGFGLDAAVVGRGVIQSAVPLLLTSLLGHELARIEARVDPSNQRASRALRALGFRFEGHARGCLDGVDGRRTQEQWAIIAGDLSGHKGHAHRIHGSTNETE
jgi:RimJ/RimL family protein N-acetyltransferase